MADEICEATALVVMVIFIVILTYINWLMESSQSELRKWRLIKLLFAVLAAIVIGSLVSVYFWMNPPSDLTYSVPIAIAVAALLLTALTATIFFRQLGVMRKQLELQNQPLPSFELSRVAVEKPRFTYVSLTKEYEFSSACAVNFFLKNIGNAPAISIHVSAAVGSLTNETVQTSSRIVNTLGENETYPMEGVDEFLYLPSDTKLTLLNGLLLSRPENPPSLEVHVFYKNVLGGCFCLENAYQLRVESGPQDGILRH